MTFPELELVIHVSYGGFHLDTEMALWLLERGWNIVTQKEYEQNYPKKYPINTLHDLYGMFCPMDDTIEFRSHPDLIECVRALQKLHEDDDWPERRQVYVHRLQVVKVKINVEIEDYNDGYERVSCWPEIRELEE